MYRPIGVTNGNETLAHLRLAKIAGRYGDFWLPACWFGFFFDVFVIATFYAFQKHRKFPGCLLGLFCIVDLVHFFRELVKGSPIPYINEEFYWTPSQIECGVIYLWVSWVEAADFVLVFTLALVIYKSVVLKEDLSYKANKKYLLLFIGVFTIYPIVYTVIVGAVAFKTGGFDLRATSCAPKSEDASIIGICQCFIALTILLVFMGSTLRYIWQVVKQVRIVADSSQNSKAWIAIRFILIVILQTAPRLSYNMYYFALAVDTNMSDASVTAASWEGSVIPIVAYYLNAMVVLWANRPLLVWIRKLYDSVPVSKTSSTLRNTASGELLHPDLNSHNSPRNINIELSEIRVVN